MRKLIAILLAGMMLLLSVNLATAEGTASVKAGDIVNFGRYPQTAEGTDQTPIEWIVLDVQDGKALLLSKYGLGARHYHWKLQDITWKDCTLRAWLNNEFLRKAFSAEEQAAILMTMVDNSKSQGYSGWNTDGGSNTMDKVFLLSYAEANHYFGVELWKVTGSDQNIAARVAPTEYAIKIGALANSEYQTADGKAAGWWWLRSPGAYQNNAVIVYAGGESGCDIVNKSIEVVRPAMWVNLESEIYRSENPQHGAAPQAEAEPFTFRGGITWGMSPEEVIALEGEEYSEMENNGHPIIGYLDVEISQYKGGLVYFFDDNQLALCVYSITDGNLNEEYDYLKKVYSGKYGEAQDFEWKKFKIFMNNINLPLHEETCVYTLCKWILADGTQIWLGQQDPDGIFIFYIEPGSRFLVEELNYTGI